MYVRWHPLVYGRCCIVACSIFDRGGRPSLRALTANLSLASSRNASSSRVTDGADFSFSSPPLHTFFGFVPTFTSPLGRVTQRKGTAAAAAATRSALLSLRRFLLFTSQHSNKITAFHRNIDEVRRSTRVPLVFALVCLCCC